MFSVPLQVGANILAIVTRLWNSFDTIIIFIGGLLFFFYIAEWLISLMTDSVKHYAEKKGRQSAEESQAVKEHRRFKKVERGTGVHTDAE